MVFDSDTKSQISTLASAVNQDQYYNVILPTEENNVNEIPNIVTQWGLKSDLRNEFGEEFFNATSNNALSESTSMYRSEYDRLGKILVVDDE